MSTIKRGIKAEKYQKSRIKATNLTKINYFEL